MSSLQKAPGEKYGKVLSVLRQSHRLINGSLYLKLLTNKSSRAVDASAAFAFSVQGSNFIFPLADQDLLRENVAFRIINIV